MNAVDVRDVALAHVRALERDGAKGQRFCAVSDPCRMRELAARLREIFGPLGYKLPSKNLPKYVSNLPTEMYLSVWSTFLLLSSAAAFKNDTVLRNL